MVELKDYEISSVSGGSYASGEAAGEKAGEALHHWVNAFKVARALTTLVELLP